MKQREFVLPDQVRSRAALIVLGALIALTAAHGQQPAGFPQAKIEVELVTLLDGGFYPSTITRSAGKVLLIVKNRSRSREVLLGVTRSDAAVVAAVETVTAVNRDYVLDLPAGTYTLKDSSHPGWRPLTIITH